MDEDCVTRMTASTLEGIAEMHQVFQKLSISNDTSLRTPTAHGPHSTMELNSADLKPYNVHDSVGSVPDA